MSFGAFLWSIFYHQWDEWDVAPEQPGNWEEAVIPNSPNDARSRTMTEPLPLTLTTPILTAIGGIFATGKEI
jgi:hypothetical protein